MKALRIWFVFLALGGLAGCNPHSKQIPTGSAMTIDNAYANPGYDHTRVLNVLLLPLNNPYRSEEVHRHEQALIASILRNFGKFNYFNIYHDEDYFDLAGPVLDVSTGRMERSVLGEVGQQYGVQAVMQVDIEEYRAFSPMRMRVRANLVDTDTGERIWTFHHTYDADDASVINALRYWWNTRIAGGDRRNRFEVAEVRPSVFQNFVFHSMARSYERTRYNNIKAIAEETRVQQRIDEEVRRVQEGRQPPLRQSID